MTAAPDADSAYPGRRLGLPESGSRSLARPLRRAVALLIDWAVATGVSLLVVHRQDGWVTLAAFAVLQVVFIATLAGSIGHLVMGLRVVPVRPAWVGVIRPAIRTVLLCLVIPAVVWDSDQRGLHDKLAGTMLVRR